MLVGHCTYMYNELSSNLMWLRIWSNCWPVVFSWSFEVTVQEVDM